MTKQTFDALKASLTPAQHLAAEFMLEREYAAKNDRKTYEEIAEEVGISTRLLYDWRKNPDFVKYTAALSDTKLDSYRSLADAQLIRLIQGTSNNGNAAIKALELFYKINGKLVDKREVVTAGPETDVHDVDAIRAEIERLRSQR